MGNESNDQVTAVFQGAVERTDIPHLYANGFMSGLGNADIVVLLQRNNVPVAVLNMSYTLAKSLSVKIGELIQGFESKTKHDIMTTTLIDQALSK